MTQNVNKAASDQNNDHKTTLPLENGGIQQQAEPKTPQSTLPSAPPKRKRKTKEERLQIALAKQAALDTKIAGLKKELDENAQKTRNRGLILVGIVVEQCFKKDVFSEENKKWWLRQTKRLPDKNRDAYVEFLETLRDIK